MDPTRTLVRSGSDYQADTLELFAAAAAEHDATTDTNKRVVLLVLPITYSLSATSSKNGERQKNLTLADNRRAMVEAACNTVKAPDQTCVAQLVPALVRADAFLAEQPRVLHGRTSTACTSSAATRRSRWASSRTRRWNSAWPRPTRPGLSSVGTARETRSNRST